MSKVQDLLSELGDLEKKSTGHRRQQESTGTAYQKAVGQLVEAIKDGGSTGDRMRDLCFLKYGSFGESAWKRLEELRQTLETHDGQLFLLIERDWICIKHVMFPSPHSQNEYGLKLTYRVGVICEPYIHLKPPKGEDWRGHPTDQWLFTLASIKWINGEQPDELQLLMGAVVPECDLGMYLGMPMHSPSGTVSRGLGSRQKSGPRIEVLVGDESVIHWFTEQSRDLEICELAERLSHQIVWTERAKQHAERRRLHLIEKFMAALDQLRQAATKVKLDELWTKVKEVEVELTRHGLHEQDPIADLIGSLPEGDFITFLVPNKSSK